MSWGGGVLWLVGKLISGASTYFLSASYFYRGKNTFPVFSIICSVANTHLLLLLFHNVFRGKYAYSSSGGYAYAEKLLASVANED